VNARRLPRHCERSEAIQLRTEGAQRKCATWRRLTLDCFVASLLAMTLFSVVTGLDPVTPLRKALRPQAGLPGQARQRQQSSAHVSHSFQIIFDAA
jgi:hypothetical protein